MEECDICLKLNSIKESLTNYLAKEIEEKQNEEKKYMERDILESQQIYTKRSKNYIYVDKFDILDFFDYDPKLVKKITEQYEKGIQYKLELDINIDKEISEFRLYSKTKEEKQYVKKYEGKMELDSALCFLGYFNHDEFLIEINDCNDNEDEITI